MAQRLRSPALDPQTVPARVGSSYPAPFRAVVEAREKRPLGDALGLSQFGVNLVQLPPGCWSSQRHWHTHEDEFVYVLEGELTLVTDAGEQLLRPGTAAGFPAGRADGHHLINRTDRPATYLEVGTRRDDVDEVDYSDIDMAVRHRDGAQMFVRKSGEPYGPATLPHRASPGRNTT
ncbi:MAG: cupin domain-containing protein [Geminicoccaceae bacterium]